MLLAAALGAFLLGVYGSEFAAWTVFIAACLQVTTRPSGPSLSLGLFGYVLMLTQIPANTGGHVLVVASLIANMMLHRGVKKPVVNTAVHLMGYITMALVYNGLLDYFNSVWPSVAAALALFAGGLAFEVVTTVALWKVTGMTWNYWRRTEVLMFTQTAVAVGVALAVTQLPFLFLGVLVLIAVPPLRNLQAGLQ